MRTLHVSVSVLGALLAPVEEQARVYDTLVLEDGRRCESVGEYRLGLAKLLQAGILHLPLGAPCPGFSFEQGCPGHEHEAEVQP